MLLANLSAWNSRLMPLFGFPLNALLFWLIWTKTPNEMRVHSRILLQTCVVDSILLLLNLIAIPLRIQHDLTIVTLLDGYFINLFGTIFHNDTKSFTYLYFIVNVFFQFNIYSISVQFLYRYLVLNRDISIQVHHYVLMLIFPFGAASFITGFWHTIVQEGLMESSNVNLREPFNGIVDWDNSICYIILVNTSNSLVYFFIWLVFYAISFAFNLFCGLKVMAFVRANNGLNPNRRAMNQQLTKSIIILALFPLMFLISTFIISALSYSRNPSMAGLVLNAQFFCGLINCWLPVVNPLASIWINTPYRKAFIEMKCFFKATNSVTKITIVQPRQTIQNRI